MAEVKEIRIVLCSKKPGKGKGRVITLLREQLLLDGIKSFYYPGPLSVLFNKDSATEELISDIESGRELNVHVVSSQEEAKAFHKDPSAITVLIDTELSRSIKCQFWLDVIKPALSAVPGLKVLRSKTLIDHENNPAVYPLQNTRITFCKGHWVSRHDALNLIYE